MPMLHDLIDCMRAGRIAHTFDVKNVFPLHEEPELFVWLLRTVSNAICFDAGDSSDVPRLKIIPELFKAPYPTTWIETKTQDSGIVGMLITEQEDGYGLAVMQKRGIPIWELVAVGDVFESGEDLRVAWPHTEGVSDLSETNIDYLRQCAVFVSHVFMALNCTNVQAVEHKAPTLINRQRVKKGKHPIFSYWTLHLPNTSDSGPAQGGTHASPRVHLRRGHIRQFIPGRYTWVNACVVGKAGNGMVQKDYAVHGKQLTTDRITPCPPTSSPT